ncbi:MAG: undecaprenyl-phosphate glucose phosphotransferase [Bacteroidia bacterium]
MKYIIPLNLIGELVIINILLLAVFFVSPALAASDIYVFSSIAWFLCTFFTKHYYINRSPGILTSILNLSTLFTFYMLVFYTFLGFFHKNEFSDSQFLIYALWLFIALIFWRITVFFILLKWLIRTNKSKKRAVIVGISTNSVYFKEFLNKHTEYGYIVLGFFSDHANSSKEKILGNFTEIELFVQNNNVDEIICSLEKVDKTTLDSIIKFAENNLITIKFIPDSSSALGYNFVLTYLELMPLLVIRKNPFDELSNKYLKRVFDIWFSLVVITFILSWLVPIISLLIVFDSKGPVFFIQKRNGLKNQAFNCLKFRTMRVNDQAHTHQATENDQRVTKIGAFLRKTSMDELPQFLNVLLGTMSVVGPRPHMLKHTEEYSQKVDRFMVRHTVKPGITGLSQVMGYRGETKELYQMKMRARVDRFYIENWSFYLDLKVIAFTILSILKKDKNAY